MSHVSVIDTIDKLLVSIKFSKRDTLLVKEFTFMVATLSAFEIEVFCSNVKKRFF